MFNNYNYFIVLAEECNISRAAKRLFITHQNLSHYLSALESETGILLFNRKPSLSLTVAGQATLETLKQIELTESNLRTQFVNLRRERVGEIRFGTTEGRFRILMPDIMSKFKEKFPDVQLRVCSAASADLRKMVVNNQLDLIVAGISLEGSTSLESELLLDERLYLVVSDNMLRSAFGSEFPACKKSLSKGADIRLFSKVPFAMNLPQMNSSQLLSNHFEALGFSPNCVHISSHPDLHHIMTSRDFAASFCLTMYLPSLMSLTDTKGNQLNIFPIAGLTAVNPVVLVHRKGRIFPHYTRSLIQILHTQCANYSDYDRLAENKCWQPLKT